MRRGLFVLGLLCMTFAAQAQVDAVATCVDENDTEVGQGLYWVRINGIDPGYDTVSVGGGEPVDLAGESFPLFFGPYEHSGIEDGGTVVQNVRATGSGSEFVLQVLETLCGYGNDTSYCVGATGRIVAQSFPGSFQGGGNSGLIQVYILTEADSTTIITHNNTGLFDGLANGTYCVWALNYDADSPEVEDYLDPGDDVTVFVDAVMNQGDLADVCLAICEPVCYEVDCVSEPIPTLGEWGLISLFLILLIMATTALKSGVRSPENPSIQG